MLVAADHVGDIHFVIVDDDREIVGRGAVRAQDDQVVELLVLDRYLAHHMVADRRRAFARRLEADRRKHAGRGLGRVAVAPGAVIADRALLGLGPLAHRLQFCRRAVAAIGAASGEQTLRDLGVMRGAGELVDDVAVPLDTEPGEAVDDGLGCLRGRALAVGILDAQAERAAVPLKPMVAREQPVEEGCARAADVQEPGRRGGKTNGDGHGPNIVSIS